MKQFIKHADAYYDLVRELENRLHALELKMVHVRSNPALGNDSEEMKKLAAEYRDVSTANQVVRPYAGMEFHA